MTLWDLRGVYEHWGRWPPVHWLVASYFGHGKKREKAQLLRGPQAEAKNREGAEALMRFMDATKGVAFH